MPLTVSLQKTLIMWYYYIMNNYMRNRKHKHILRNLLIISVIAVVLTLIFYKPESAQIPAEPSADISENASSAFEIYFLDVGQGDAALISCEGHSMLIDGGASSQSRKIFSFLESHGINHLDYIVASHADADHVGGLAAALNFSSVDVALCTVTKHDTKSFNDFLKYLGKQSVSLTVPDAGSTYSLGSAEFTVILPENGVSYSDNTSLVIRIVYGDTSFLFTGDAEYDDEQAAIASGTELKSTVLKVGHHGSSSSSSYNFINAASPEYAVISVGNDNTYGHPAERVLNRLGDAGVTVFRTDMQGDIHCTSDGKTVRFDVHRNADADTLSSRSG